MKTRILSLFVIATFIFSFSANAQQGNNQRNWSQTSPEKQEMIKKHFAQQRAERENFFTDEQKEAMKKIHLETAKAEKPLKNELNELIARQKTLSTADEVDLKAINKNIDKMAELKAEMAKIRAKSHQEIRALLNEEQLLKFDAMQEKRGKLQQGDIRRQRMQRNSDLGRGA